MSKKLYVANFDFRTTDHDLSRLFAEYGSVESAQVARDRATKRSRGFGFVEMSADGEAAAAIAGLNGKEVQGRPLLVQEYRPKEQGDRPRRQAPRPKRTVRERKKRPPALGSRLRKPRPKP